MAEEVGWVHSFDLPRFVIEVLKMYADFKAENPSADFTRWWSNSGKEAVTALCTDHYNSIPSFAEDKNYYFDQGGDQLFSVKDIGRAECSAGMYDMIDVDDTAIKKLLRALDSGHAADSVLRELVFRSTRMLLVTRGQEARSEQEAQQLFVTHFIDTGLDKPEHRLVLDTTKKCNATELQNHVAEVAALGREITELYQQMDSTMRFPGETKNMAVAQQRPVQEAAAPEQRKADRFKDLTGVKCPLNFARTKVMLACMNPGQTLEILLDNGEPIDNVPGSVRQEGHRILRQEKTGEQWTVVIEKV
jgi:sulfite reductase (ferredoxin)